MIGDPPPPSLLGRERIPLLVERKRLLVERKRLLVERKTLAREAETLERKRLLVERKRLSGNACPWSGTLERKRLPVKRKPCSWAGIESFLKVRHFDLLIEWAPVRPATFATATRRTCLRVRSYSRLRLFASASALFRFLLQRYNISATCASVSENSGVREGALFFMRWRLRGWDWVRGLTVDP